MDRTTNPSFLLAVLITGLIVAAGTLALTSGQISAPPISGSSADASASTSASDAPKATLVAGAVTIGDPIRKLTPGSTNGKVTQGTVAETICSPYYLKDLTPSAATMAKLLKKQIAAYGYEDTDPDHYVADHLVPIDLDGKATDLSNIFPQPKHVILEDGTDVGADIKDTFESYLHRSVCNLTMSLKDAQAGLKGDWVGFWIEQGRPGK